MGIIVHLPIDFCAGGAAAGRAKKLSGRDVPRKADGCRGVHVEVCEKPCVNDAGGAAANASDGAMAGRVLGKVRG